MPVAFLLFLSSLPRPGAPTDPLVLPVSVQAPTRPAIPEAPALAPKEAVELDLSLAGDVTRPAPEAVQRSDVRPRPSRAMPVSPELREAALAILRGWLEQIEARP